MGGHPWGKGGRGKAAFVGGGISMTDPRIPGSTPLRFEPGRVDDEGGAKAPGMREIVFLVTAEQPGRIEAMAPERGLVVEAPTLEELHHEARDALIRQVGPSHGTYRIRIRRGGHPVVVSESRDQPAQRHPFPKTRPVPTGKPVRASRAIAVELEHHGATMILN